MVFAKEDLVGGAEASRQGTAVAPLSLRSQRMGLPRDAWGSQRQTRSSGDAASLLWGGVYVLRRAVHFHREASCRDGVAQDDVGKWASRWGPREVLGR